MFQRTVNFLGLFSSAQVFVLISFVLQLYRGFRFDRILHMYTICL